MTQEDRVIKQLDRRRKPVTNKSPASEVLFPGPSGRPDHIVLAEVRISPTVIRRRTAPVSVVAGLIVDAVRAAQESKQRADGGNGNGARRSSGDNGHTVVPRAGSRKVWVVPSSAMVGSAPREFRRRKRY